MRFRVNSLWKNIACLLVLTIVMTLATVPSARAQTTSITNLQAPSSAIAGSGEVHITFTVSYSPGSEGAAIGIGIADADTSQGTWVFGRIYSSTPNNCTEGTEGYAYCYYTLSSNVPGSVSLDFVFQPTEARTYHLEAAAFVFDSGGNEITDSISTQSFSITVTDSGIIFQMYFTSELPSGDIGQVDFVIDGVNYTTVCSISGCVLSNIVPASPGQHTVEVSMIYPLKEDVRAVFMGWEADHITGVMYPNQTTLEVSVQTEGTVFLNAEYKIQYFLNLTSPYGSVSGEGWYDAGSTANISVNPDQLSAGGILGLLGVKNVFANWQGAGTTVMPAAGEIIMNSSHVLQAVWQTDYSALYLSAGVLGVFLLVLSIAGAYTYKKRQVILDFSWLRDYMEKHGAVVIQDIRCPYCGGEVHLPDKGTYTNCIHCGHTVYVKQIFDLVKDAIDKA